MDKEHVDISLDALGALSTSHTFRPDRLALLISDPDAVTTPVVARILTEARKTHPYVHANIESALVACAMRQGQAHLFSLPVPTETVTRSATEQGCFTFQIPRNGDIFEAFHLVLREEEELQEFSLSFGGDPIYHCLGSEVLKKNYVFAPAPANEHEIVVEQVEGRTVTCIVVTDYPIPVIALSYQHLDMTVRITSRASRNREAPPVSAPEAVLVMGVIGMVRSERMALAETFFELALSPRHMVCFTSGMSGSVFAQSFIDTEFGQRVMAEAYVEDKKRRTLKTRRIAYIDDTI